MKFSNVVLGLFITLMISQCCIAQTTALEGSWLGTLAVSGAKLRLVYNIKYANDSLKVTLDSPDQGAKGIIVNKAFVNNDTVTFISYVINARFQGVYIKDSTMIEGIFEQANHRLPIKLKRIDAEIALHRPQEPKRPLPYKEEEITYKNSKAGIQLAGTLTMPLSGENFPVVILITGSGPQDRDETIMGHKPFFVLAHDLTQRGIAVLRMDDRGVARSTGNFQSATSEDFAEDILAAVEYIKNRKEINANKIGLIGHSEGGMIAPMVAVRSTDVHFIVMMAGIGIPGEKILSTQVNEIYKRMGATPEEIKSIWQLTEKAKTLRDKQSDLTKLKVELEQLIHAELKTISDNTKQKFGLDVNNLLLMLASLNSPWMKYFMAYNPESTLKKIKIPVLAINGSEDVQVLADINLKGIEDALKQGGNKHYKIQKLEGLNHLFQKADTGLPDEYVKIEETINPVALNVISSWILMITNND